MRLAIELLCLSLLTAAVVPTSAEAAKKPAKKTKTKTKAKKVSVRPAAPAPTPDPDEEKKNRAKTEAEQATVQFKLGRFGDALQGYERAYEIFQAKGLLFNIGICHRNLGHHEKAAFFFTSYLRENPQAKNADEVSELLADEKKKQAELVDREKQAAISSSAPVALAAAPTSAPALGLAPTPVSLVQAAPVHERWWFWVAIVGGAAAVAVAVAVPVALTREPSTTLGRLDRSR